MPGLVRTQDCVEGFTSKLGLEPEWLAATPGSGARKEGPWVGARPRCFPKCNGCRDLERLAECAELS